MANITVIPVVQNVLKMYFFTATFNSDQTNIVFSFKTITGMRYKAVCTHVHLFVLHCITTWRQPGLS